MPLFQASHSTLKAKYQHVVYHVAALPSQAAVGEVFAKQGRRIQRVAQLVAVLSPVPVKTMSTDYYSGDTVEIMYPMSADAMAAAFLTSLMISLLWPISSIT